MLVISACTERPIQIRTGINMIYGQAMKFLNTQVFAVLEDQTILRGTLTRVDSDGHGLITSNELRPIEHKVHLRYIFPQK